MIHSQNFIPTKNRYSFDELDEQTQAAWLDLAHFVLRNGNHDHRDWKLIPNRRTGSVSAYEAAMGFRQMHAEVKP